MSRVKCYNCKKEGHFAKDCKKAKVKDYKYYKTKMLLAKKDKNKQVLLAEDQAWMESSSDSDQEINASMVFMAQIEKVLFDFEASSLSTDEKISEKHVEKANQQSKDFENQNKDLQDKYDVLKNQTTTFEMNNNELNEQMKELIEKKKYAKLEAERYEYMIRYSAYFDNDKQHRKQIADQQVLYDKISVQLVELDKHVRELKNTVLEKDFKISELEECVRNKDLEIDKCLERFTPMFLTHSDEALEIKKFKISRENKIEFAYDYGNLNASYVNEKINFEDNYFQDIINPDFEKIDSPFHQTSSLKPYVPNLILEKIIIDLEDEVRKSSKQNVKQVDNDVSRANSEFVHFLDLDTSSSVRRPKNSDVIWKKKGLSNTSNVGLSAVSVLNLNKIVKRYSRKDLLSCNNSHLGETRSDLVCNDAMNVFCNYRMNDLLDDNNFFIFDDVNVRISPVSKMPFRKKPRDSMHMRSKSNSNKSLP
nr:hypothetical protein [Tanacetum cinerariifolium]